MRATAVMEPQLRTKASSHDVIVRFDEGLIGFAECKEFVLVESEGIRPFRLLQHLHSSEFGFVVLDPTVRFPDYYNQIPAREWESIGVTDPAKRLAFVIVNIGLDPTRSTGNFQAPLLVNYETMSGRQVILTDSSFCLRQPIAR